MSGDTIAAIATAPGRGGVAIVRVSGPGAFGIARVLTGKDPLPERIRFTRFHGDSGKTLDSGLLLAFRGPRSYTGEDVVEFQCHGGSVSPQRLLDACFAAGARLARRGEFTERAFLNGKLDLSEAESVIELVDAKTDRAADDALARLDGIRKTAYRKLYDTALEISATLEHALDVDEDELPDGFLPGVADRLHALDADLAASAASATAGRLLRDGALVVLAGAPNAGKSSLMNSLLGESRVLVSDTPGTTRDAIEAWLDIGGWPVRLVDTAGLRETADAIEAEGVRRAEDLVAGADLVLALAEPDQPFPATDDNPSSPPSDKTLYIRSKSDLLAQGAPSRAASACGAAVLAVSAKTGDGLAELKTAIASALAARAGLASDGSATASERERSYLAEARRALAGAPADDPVLLANAARACARTLGEMTGAEYSADLLDNLFSRFCVGK